MKTWRQLSIWVVGDYLLLAAFRLDHSEVCVVQKSEWKDLKDGMENGLIFFRLWRVFWKALVVSEETSIVREKTQIVYLYAKEGFLRTRLYSHLKREQLERMLGKKKKLQRTFFPNLLTLSQLQRHPKRHSNTTTALIQWALITSYTDSTIWYHGYYSYDIVFFFQAHQI